MGKKREDLKAILDLLAEWRKENGVGYVTMAILEDGSGCAYTLDEPGGDVETGYHQYDPREEERG